MESNGDFRTFGYGAAKMVITRHEFTRAACLQNAVYLCSLQVKNRTLFCGTNAQRNGSPFMTKSQNIDSAEL